MKNLKKVLALVLAVVMIMGTVAVASAKDYKDVKADNDYAVAIDVLSSLNILDGFEDGTFKADGKLTRAQAAKIVAIVHNAATTGKIKGQDEVSALYANAQNSFVDCNDSWALPFINYCRITGLADGMTKTTYAPNRQLTGVQWLKLMLTTLNFDTAKEGYTGTGWDVNVLNRANEIGLTDGLAEGWRGIAEVTRGEAAQILFNALKACLVEYGQLIKNYPTTGTATATHPWKAAFVSNEQVNKTDMTLGAKMNIKETTGYDDFWRPVTTWKYDGKVVATFFKNEVARFTTLTSYCDLLKAIGVSEAAATKVKFEGIFVNGYRNTNELLPTAYNITNGYGHQSAKGCQSDYVGGQGVLTQVFKTADGVYRITEVASFLGHVSTAKKVSHPTSTQVTFDAIYGRDGAQTGNRNLVRDHRTLQQMSATIASTDFAANDYALVAISYKDAVLQGATGLENATNGGSTYVVDAEKTVGTVATLNGAIGEYRSMPSQTRIDGTYVNDAWAFMQDYTAAHTITNSGSKYVFFYDTYGNVIGMVGYTDAKSYFVADSIYKTYETGTYTANAKLVNFEKEASDVKLSKVTNHAVNGQGIDIPSKGNALAAVSTGVDFKLDKAETPNTLYYGLIYSYVDGVLTREGQNTIPSGTNVSFTHAKNAAEIKGNVGFNWEYKLDENTKFLVKKVDGTFESYTGCTALPALTASVMDYVTADGTNNSYCTMVYLGGAVYGDESVTGYVATFQQHDWADGYERVTVYVAGEATVVLVPKTMLNATLSSYPAGVYTFATAVQKDGTVCATSITAKDAALAPITAQVVGFGAGVVTVVDTDSVALNQYTLSLKDVKIYDARGTVLTVIDAETLETAFNDAQGLVPAATVTVKIYSTGIAAIDGIYLVG